jgi:uncharacterized protein YggE
MSHIRSARAAGAAVLVTLVCAAPAAAQAPAPPNTITVTGTGSVKPSPQDRKSNASIAKAVEAAEAAATPLAIADGRGRAASLASLAGMTLGPLIAISEGVPSPFGFYGPVYGQQGTFGPGKFCGTVRTPIFRRTPSGGRKLVRTRTRHTCRIPPQVTESLGMTFAAVPPPPPA